ncbi:hemerythrin domain-containing protein [Novispirillum sp. DQ9]|uniref:hemerythrin domain-containing protein n=1 Tax=Novispirillum sp. DQ9 TaxID=3398612 RepID=UPI003C7B3D72
MPQIYDMLRNDHQTVRTALERIIGSGNSAQKTRHDLFAKVKEELEIHTKFEEEVFYPTFRADKNDKQAKEEVKDAMSEHKEAKQMLAKLEKMDVTSDEFIDTIKELKDALEHHIHDEEDEIFPQAREAVSDEEAEDMAKKYAAMKKKAH